MANENSEIGDIVKKCKILLLDIEGTTTSINFVKDKLFPYAEENVKQFLESQWECDDVKEAVTALRKLALEDAENKLEGVVSIPGEDAAKEEQIEGLVNSVKWQMATDRKVGALKMLQGLIWKQGYDSGELKGHVYEDVQPALQQWRSLDEHKVYIYSSGSVQAQKLLFGQSMAGDLLPHIDGHFDTAVGAKQEQASYKAIIDSIGCKSDEILFLTDILKEAEAARGAGLHVALISREGNAPLSSEATSAYPLLHSLAQLTVSYKRKTDPQDEQPAKILKTEADKDVKSNSEVQVTNSEKEIIAEDKIAEEEKMEVENVEAPAEQNKSEKVQIAVVTLAEDITESSDVVEPSIATTEAVVIEEIKESSKSTEEIDSITKNVSTQEKTNENDKTTNVNATTEEASSIIITEIEELPSDKVLEDVGDIIEHLEPMVEEPVADEDMDELRNVGEVLEKECDEILSKVQDVTNLATITVKPLLNPIIEEAMETDTADSNDIVDRILDTELEMEMKQNELTLETVSETIKAGDHVQVNEEVNGDNCEKKCEDELITESNSVQSDIPHAKMDVISPAEIINKETGVSKEKQVEIEESQEITKGLLKKETKESEKVSVKVTNEQPESNVNAASDDTMKETTKENVHEGTLIADDLPVLTEILKNDKIPESLPMEQTTERIDAHVATTNKMEEDGMIQKNTLEVKTNKLETSSPMEESTVDSNEVCIPEKVDKEVEKREVKEANTAGAVEIDIVEENRQPHREDKAIKINESSTVEQNASDNSTESSNLKTNVESKIHDQPENSENENKMSLETNGSQEKRPELVKDVQVNGKATTNGDSEAVINGDTRKDEELNSRLSSENEKEVNGSNGEALETEQGQGDKKVEKDMTDIKVKTVSTDEPRTDPVDQPTEA